VVVPQKPACSVQSVEEFSSYLSHKKALDPTSTRWDVTMLNRVIGKSPSPSGKSETGKTSTKGV
jgi:hypothetical protein